MYSEMCRGSVDLGGHCRRLDTRRRMETAGAPPRSSTHAEPNGRRGVPAALRRARNHDPSQDDHRRTSYLMSWRTMLRAWKGGLCTNGSVRRRRRRRRRRRDNAVFLLALLGCVSITHDAKPPNPGLSLPTARPSAVPAFSIHCVSRTLLLNDISMVEPVQVGSASTLLGAWLTARRCARKPLLRRSGANQEENATYDLPRVHG